MEDHMSRTKKAVLWAGGVFAGFVILGNVIPQPEEPGAVSAEVRAEQNKEAEQKQSAMLRKAVEDERERKAEQDAKHQDELEQARQEAKRDERNRIEQKREERRQDRDMESLDILQRMEERNLEMISLAETGESQATEGDIDGACSTIDELQALWIHQTEDYDKLQKVADPSLEGLDDLDSAWKNMEMLMSNMKDVESLYCDSGASI
jgi:hypothetical protein